MRKNLPKIYSALTKLILIAAWLGAALLLPHGFWHKLINLLYLLIVPGYFIFQTITAGRYKLKYGVSKVLTYSVGLSLISLMLTGLIINEIYTFINLPNPLSLHPLAYAIAGMSAFFAITASYKAKPKLNLKKFKQEYLQKISIITAARRVPIYAGLLLLPFLAIGGANTLNNNGSDWLALTVMGAIGFIFLAAAWGRKSVRHYYPLILFSICASLLLGTSMRGWNITGHDIMQEYQVFQLTINHSAWHMRYYQDAYTACLSITILPTILARLTGISDPYIYKFAFQLFFALIGPLIYSTLRDYVPKRLALLSAFVFISFPVFITDITMLNRQETAILCLALAVQAALDKRLKPHTKSILSFIFLVGMVLSHYSTSYVAVGILLLALAFEIACSIGGRLPYIKKYSVTDYKSKVSRLFSVPVILASALVLIGWGTLATRTSNNLVQTVEGIAAAASGNLPKVKAQAAVPTSVSQYANSISSANTLSPSDYYPASVTAKYPIKAASQIVEPVSGLLHRVGVKSSFILSLFNYIRSGYGLLIELLVGAGLVCGWFYRRHSKLPRQFVLLGAGSLIITAAEVLLPTQLINYSVTRVIQESLIFLALPIVLAALWIFRWIRIPSKYREQILAGGLVLFFFVLSGFFSTLTGGYKPVLALSNTGLYYQAYYTHQDEVSVAQWLDTQIPVGSHIYSDEFMRRKVIANDDIFPQTGIIPAALPLDSYVVISHGDTEFNEIPAYDGNQVIYYKIPYQFLNQNKNLVYSSGSVLIYK
jgi:uncharacterized membrane protein